MHQDTIVLPVEQRLLPQPGHEFVAVRGIQDLRQGIATTEGGQTRCHGEEKQVVIAEDRDGGRPEIPDVA
jgi:hypothetical protein